MNSAQSMTFHSVPGFTRTGPTVYLPEQASPCEVSIVLVDEDAIVRAGTRRLLELAPGIRVLGEARRGDEALELAVATEPDVAVLDIRLPGLPGIEVIRRLAKASPATRALVLSASDEANDVIAALEAGASGYLLKRASAAMLQEAVRAVHAGTTVLDPDLVSGILASRPSPARAGLSPREVEVAALMGQGMSNEAIAMRLGISRRTVEKHISHVYMKIDPPWRHPATRRHGGRRASAARASAWNAN